MWFRIDNDGGRGGRRGLAGEPGRGGIGGLRRARRWPDGRPGRRGAPGADGDDGRPGSVTFQIVADDGTVTESAPALYHAAVAFQGLYDADADGVFEPGSEFEVRGLRVRNTGPLSLPSSVLEFRGRHGCDDVIGDPVPLPRIPPRTDYAVRNAVRLRVPDATLSETRPNQPYMRHVVFRPAVVLAGVAFDDDDHHHGTVADWVDLVVQFPYRLDVLARPALLTTDEDGSVRLRITTLGARPFGVGTPDLEVHVLLGSGLRFMSAKSDTHCQVMNPQFARCTVSDAGTAGPVEFDLALTMCAHAGSRPFTATTWTAILLLRGRPIDQVEYSIRSVPRFDPADSAADALLVTSSALSADQCTLWLDLLDRLGLGAAIWDLDRYGALSIPSASWLGAVQYLVVVGVPAPLSDLISCADLAAHLSQPNAGLVCVDCHGLDEALFDFDADPVIEQIARRRWWHGPGSLDRRAARLCATIHGQEPQFLHRAVIIDDDDGGSGGGHHRLRVYRSAVPRSARLLAVHGALQLQGRAGPGSAPHPWYSPQAAALFALVALLSPAHKLQLLDGVGQHGDGVAVVCDRSLTGRDPVVVGLRDIVHLAILQEIRHEFKSKSLRFPSCQELVSSLRRSPDRLSAHGALILAALQRHLRRTRAGGLGVCMGLRSVRRRILQALHDQLQAVARHHGLDRGCRDGMRAIQRRTPRCVRRLFKLRMHQVWVASHNARDRAPLRRPRSSSSSSGAAGPGSVPCDPATRFLKTVNSAADPFYRSDDILI